jgi:hypothetical protein
MPDNMNETHDEMTDDAPIAPLVPPAYLLGASGLAFVIALFVLLGTPTFGAVGWGALVAGVLLLLLTVVLAPQQAADFFTGRGFRFGGTSIFFTVLFLAALVVVYWFIGTQDEWRVDLTQTDEYSLNDDARATVERLAADPTIPQVEILGFYDATAANQREQTDILLSAFEEASDGKVTYRFVDPNREPLLAQTYGVTNGTLVIQNTTVDDPESAETVNTNFAFDQNQLTNAIVRVVASGDFNVYFLEVTDGVDINDPSEVGAANFIASLDRLRWNVNGVSVTDLTAEQSQFTLNDPNLDGEVLVIAGGREPLSPSEVTFITDYLDLGGSVVISAMADAEDPALASTEALNTYLAENFGLSFEDEYILDPVNSFGGVANFIAVSDIRRNITASQLVPQGFLLAMDSARPITVADIAPDNVTTYELATTGPDAYGKTVNQLLEQDYEVTEDDPIGPFTVAAAAENTETGARVVLVSSSELFMNQFEFGQQIANWELGYGSMIWAMRYDDFVEGEQPLLPQFDVRPADQPIFADTAQLRRINFISLFVLPFGALVLSGVVWFSRRQGR